MNASASTAKQSLAAVALVAVTYIYFLLFAQFGFLQGIRATGLGADAILAVLTGMAVAGVATSLAAPRVVDVFGPGGTMGLGLLVGAGAAASAGFTFASGLKTTGHLLIAAIGIGAGLGLLTVGLAADLRRLTRTRRLGLCVGGGTGLAYLVCNVPAVYGAGPTTKAWGVAVLAAVAIAVVMASRGPAGAERTEAAALVPTGWRGARGLVWVVAGFLALVWFDSAAFAALQLTPELHQRHWGDAAARWTNGGAHAIAAVLAGIALDRGGVRSVLVVALVLLVGGALAFPRTGFAAPCAAPIYAGGVSLYSTALAAFAALAPAGAGRERPAWRAAWLYAIAGWIGSAAGVGLAEDRGHLPGWAAPAAVLVVATAVLGSFGRRKEATCAAP